MSVNLAQVWLGGDVFGWSADAHEALQVMDAAHEGGILAIDTSDVYPAWAHEGRMGVSEEIIGRWVSSRGVRAQVTIGTKVGYYAMPIVGGIGSNVIHSQIDKSLRRLQTDYVDIYYAHRDDGGDLHDTLTAFSELIKSGKIRSYGLSNFSAARIREAVEICNREGLPRPAAIQTRYSLLSRDFEFDIRNAVSAGELAVIGYSVLAHGFLTGKYQAGVEASTGRGDNSGAHYLNDLQACAVLEVVREVAAAHAVSPAAAAIAWVRQQPTVAAAMSSARKVEQLAPMIESRTVELTAEEVGRLEQVSRKSPPRVRFW